MQLRRRYNEIYYHKGNQEVDFCFLDENRHINLINASFEIQTQATYQREITGLVEGMEFYGLSNSLIITRDHEKTIEIGNKTINVVPLWKWLL